MAEFDTPQSIREAPLPRAFRGVDEDATRELLRRIAHEHKAALDEVERLNRQLATERAASGAAKPELSPEAEASAMTDMLLVAKRASDQIMLEAKEKAEALRAAAEGERAQLLERAASEAAERAQHLRDEVQALEHQRDSLRATIEHERASFVSLLETSLQRLDGVTDRLDLPEALRSRVQPELPA